LAFEEGREVKEMDEKGKLHGLGGIGEQVIRMPM